MAQRNRADFDVNDARSCYVIEANVDQIDIILLR